MKNPKKLAVYPKAVALAVGTYRTTNAFPRDERFGLTMQMRRAAVSVGSNIAEGCGRDTDRDLAHFLNVALGSATELEFQLVVAVELGFGVAAELAALDAQIVEMKKMLSRFAIAVRARISVAERRPKRRLPT